MPVSYKLYISPYTHVYMYSINCFNKIIFGSRKEIVDVKGDSEVEGKDLFIDVFSLDHFI